jgi:membrane protein required for colicin V production
MDGLTTLDSVVLAILAIGAVRGFWIGLIREGFSIAALGGGLLAVRYGIAPVAGLLEQVSGGGIGPTASLWIAGIAIGLAVVFVIGTVGKLLRKGARAVGLGWADRIGGAVIGAAEGALAAGVILVVATWVLGPDDPLVESSKSIDVLESLQDYVAEHSDELPAVASPGDWLPKRE